jgi:hypothetical protein
MVGYSRAEKKDEAAPKEGEAPRAGKAVQVQGPSVQGPGGVRPGPADESSESTTRSLLTDAPSLARSEPPDDADDTLCTTDDARC